MYNLVANRGHDRLKGIGLNGFFGSFSDVGLVILLVKETFVILLGNLKADHLTIISIVVELLHRLPAGHPHEQFTRFFLELTKHVEL